MIFQTPPPDFVPAVEVVGAYITCQDKLLLLQRHDKQSMGGKWGQPAGKMELGETPLEGMCRELREETGLVPDPDELTFFKTLYVRGPDRDLVFHMFRLKFLAEPTIVLNGYDHQAFRWATPKEALTMDLIHDNEETIKLVFNL